MKKKVVKPVNPPPLAAPMTFMTMQEYKTHLRKGRGFIYKLLAQGLPHIKSGDGQTSSLLFPVEQADAWLLARFATKRSGKWRPPSKPKAQAKPAAQPKAAAKPEAVV
jgi:hypothetical protein